MNLPLAEKRPPVPPADLILRVTPSFGADGIEQGRQAFDEAAIQHLELFDRALSLDGRSFTDFQRALDFGCGCGRFLRHLGAIADLVEIHGTDIDAEMIDWCRANIPYSQFELAPHEPPLPYADGHFDLVINHSVFTHLDERLQDLWLSELQRITQPGAILLLTVEGTGSWNRMCDAVAAGGEDMSAWRTELESRGIVFIRDDVFIGSTHPDFYHSTFHAPWYVYEHWTRFFDIVAHLPDGSITQDLVVLRRRPDGSRAASPIGRRHTAPPLPPRGGRGALAESVLARGRRLADRWSHRSTEPDASARELDMLRAGLYEQGNRISVLAAELRGEIESLRNGDSE